MSELVVKGASKSFGATRALDGVDLTVPTGRLAAVLGPSGCGKTTLLRIVAGFLAPDSGSVTIAGREVAGPRTFVPPERRRVGVVPQEGALFPHLDVAGNVGFGLARGRGRQRSARVEELLELVGLPGYGARMPAQLSGGQQQRVAVARALAPEPDLVLLDEPFSALDAGLRASLREDVRRALRLTGATGVLVTHDQQEALSTADLVAVMRDGTVVQAAAPAELYRSPADIGVATFVGDAIVVRGRLREGLAHTVLGPVPVLAGRGGREERAGRVVVRPEQLHVRPAGTGVPARIVGRTFFGHDSLLRLAITDEDGENTTVNARVLGHGPVDGQEWVGLEVRGHAMFYGAV